MWKLESKNISSFSATLEIQITPFKYIENVYTWLGMQIVLPALSKGRLSVRNIFDTYIWRKF